MILRARSAILFLVLAVLAFASTASAQVFGTFTWEMQPYCNKVTLTITQIPSGYTIDGFDDQCGAARRAGAVGMVHINPDGTVGLNFAIIAAPSGVTVHVAAALSPANGSGSWADNVGRSGTLALGATTPNLPQRPLPPAGIAPGSITSVEIAAGAVGVTQINTTQVQARVSGACAAGQSVRSINADGTVVCVTTSRAAAPCFDTNGATTNRYKDCGNGTVTDSATGLIWLKNPNCLGSTFFAESNLLAATLAAGTCGLTDGSAPGDWRLPTKLEWEETIRHARGTVISGGLGCTGASGPSLTNDSGDACYATGAASSFPGVVATTYWSSTTYDVNPNNAWYIDLATGTPNDFLKTQAAPKAWPVRGTK